MVRRFRELLEESPGWRVVARLVALSGMVVAAGLLLDRLFPPDLSRWHDRSQLVVDRHGELLRPFLSQDQKWRLTTTVPQVDPHYLEMLIAFEDRRFFHHPGVDPLALVRAVGQWLVAGRPVSGASTLTMQVARLLEPRPRTLPSKFLEMLRSLQLEWRFSKEEILAFYLTLAPMGGNLEGIRAASLAYLGKEPDLLSRAEAALMVALPQAPTSRRPDRHPDKARLGVVRVLERVAAAGVIPPDRAAEAATEPLPDSRRPFPRFAPHLAVRLVARHPREQELVTTLEAPRQRAMEALAERHAAAWGDGATVALLVVENGPRAVRAYVSGHDFEGPAGQVDLLRAPRSPGSALKPFLYGLAMDDLAIHPETLLEDRPLRFGDYAPRNFDTDFHGTLTVREALQQSLNLPAIALMDRVGSSRMAGVLRRGGARLHFPRHHFAPGLALALGGVGITLEELTALYLHLAHGGAVGEVRLLRGEGERETGVPLLSPPTVWHLTRILAATPPPERLSQQSGGTGRAAIAFKTGTSYGFRDAWAIGYNARYTVGVWVGRADGTPRPGHYGRNTAAPILFQAFDLLPPGGDPRLPLPPEGTLVAATNAQLPEGLRRFRPAAATLGAMQPHQGEPPRILFPPNGAEVELSRPDGGVDPLLLTAEGGTPPLRWVVNGAPLGTPARRPSTSWQPDGLGFARIVLLDARDRTAVSRVRIR